MTSKDVKPLLLGVGERRKTKDLGPGGSPGKIRPRTLESPSMVEVEPQKSKFLTFLKFCLDGWFV